MQLLSRGLYYLSLLGGVVLFSFILFHVIPSDPARVVLGPNAEEAQVTALRKELGLDAPLPLQFLLYLGKVVRLNFGHSYVDRRSVSQEVGSKLKVSLILLACSFSLSFIYLVGVIVAELLLRRPVGDYLDFLWVSTPTLFSGVLVALLSIRFYPFTTFSGTFDRMEDYLYFLPPAFVLALYPMAILSRIVRGEIRTIERSMYIRTARAFGIPERTILSKHILKNALVPFLAAFSNQIPILFTGAFIVEVIFSLPGIGSLLITSILQRDFPMLEGIVILNSLVILLVYLAVEAIYPFVDPRIRDAHVR
jgi:peptide/nickel transport system permease protein